MADLRVRSVLAFLVGLPIATFGQLAFEARLEQLKTRWQIRPLVPLLGLPLAVILSFVLASAAAGPRWAILIAAVPLVGIVNGYMLRAALSSRREREYLSRDAGHDS